jgi:hypothetical protein
MKPSGQLGRCSPLAMVTTGVASYLGLTLTSCASVSSHRSLDVVPSLETSVVAEQTPETIVERPKPADDPRDCLTPWVNENEIGNWRTEVRRRVANAREEIAECFEQAQVANGHGLAISLDVDREGSTTSFVFASDPDACTARSCIANLLAAIDLEPAPASGPRDDRGVSLVFRYHPLTTNRVSLEGDARGLPMEAACVPPRTPPSTVSNAPSDPVLAEVEPRLLECHRAGLARNPGLSGYVTAVLAIRLDGSVEDVRIASNTLADCDVVSCMQARLGELRFAESDHARGMLLQRSFAPGD